jgi:hypothetical protein
MPTKRKKTKAVSRAGVNWTKFLVEKNNDIFQEIDLENDVGNDAYIEFVINEETTGCCIASQIKTGKSYINASGEYFFQSDKEHFEYWNSHLLPICALVHNPENNTTKWIDITKYLDENSHVIENGPYSLKCGNELSERTFDEFKNHFLGYSKKMDHSFIRSLDVLLENKSLSSINDALHLLFSYYRNKKVTWYFVCQYFKEVKDKEIINLIVYMFSFVTGSYGDVFWHSGNIVDNKIKVYIKNLVQIQFKESELIKLIEVFNRDWFSRGTLSQAAHSLIDWIKDKNDLLYKITFQSEYESDIKLSSLMLLLYYKSWEEDGPTDSLKVLEQYISLYPYSEDIDIVEEMVMSKEEGCLGFY